MYILVLGQWQLGIMLYQSQIDFSFRWLPIRKKVCMRVTRLQTRNHPFGSAKHMQPWMQELQKNATKAISSLLDAIVSDSRMRGPLSHHSLRQKSKGILPTCSFERSQPTTLESHGLSLRLLVSLHRLSLLISHHLRKLRASCTGITYEVPAYNT